MKNYEELLDEIRLAAIDNMALISITDSKGVIIYVNNMFCAVSGYSEKELLNKTHSVISSGKHPKTVWAELWKTISKGYIFEKDIINKSKDGSEYCVRTKISKHTVNKKDYFVSVRFLINDFHIENKKLENLISKIENFKIK